MAQKTDDAAGISAVTDRLSPSSVPTCSAVSFRLVSQDGVYVLKKPICASSRLRNSAKQIIAGPQLVNRRVTS